MNLKKDNYTILEEIGRGGMGVVYRARQESLDRDVAIKELDLSRIQSTPEAAERFRLEARAAASLVHPNIIMIYDFWEDDSTAYIAMEFINGIELKDILTCRGALSPVTAARIAMLVCSALGYAHRRGMIHRDVKPANIMLTTDGDVKLMDFGIVSVSGATDLTVKGQIIGTPAYMSPEQIRGESLNPASDVFSLGAVIYEMVTGSMPFPGDSHISQIHSVLHEQPAPLISPDHALGDEFTGVIMRALEKDPGHRFPDMENLSDALLQSLPPEALSGAPGISRLVEEARQASPSHLQPPSGTSMKDEVQTAGQPDQPSAPSRHDGPSPPDDIDVVSAHDATRLSVPEEELPPAADLPPLVEDPELSLISHHEAPEEPEEGEPSVPALSLKDIPEKAVDDTIADKGSGKSRTIRRLISLAVPVVLILIVVIFIGRLQDRPAGRGTPGEGTSAGGEAVLAVAARPWGRVFLDGKLLGNARPTAAFRIPAGLHTVIVRNPKLGVRSFIVDLKRGERKRLVADFRKEP